MVIKPIISRKISKFFPIQNTQKDIGNNGESDRVDLYLDSQSEIALKKEASLFELSPSAFVRVLARIWSEPADEVLTMTIAQFRIHVQELVTRENRRV